METWKDPTEDGRNSLTRGMGPTTTSAPPGKGHWEDLSTDLEGWRGHTLSGSARREEKRGNGTYSAHEIQECGSDGWVGLHGVVHDQDGWLWRAWS